MTTEEFDKMKAELEAEYLATFKKTVAMHEVFLQRLAQHPRFRQDSNFRIFLEYSQDLSVRGKNKKEKISGILANFSKSADDLVLSSTQKDIDEFFDKERTFLSEYYTHIRDATMKADRMTRAHKNVADSYIKISAAFTGLASIDPQPGMSKFYQKISDSFEKARKIEGRVSSDEDLKLADTLRYYMKDTQAAKDLLYRRLRALANYEAANRNLDKARVRNREVVAAEAHQQESCEKFEKISKLARQGKSTFLLYFTYQQLNSILSSNYFYRSSWLQRKKSRCLQEELYRTRWTRIETCQGQLSFAWRISNFNLICFFFELI